MIHAFTHWLGQHTVLLGVLAVLSTVLLLASIVATPWIIARLPQNYLLQRDNSVRRHPLARLSIDVVRTLSGFALIVFGLLMLVMPGPGLITLLLGLSIARFPGKRRLLRHIASRDSVFNSLNWMRRRHGRPPLIHPHQEEL